MLFIREAGSLSREGGNPLLRGDPIPVVGQYELLTMCSLLLLMSLRGGTHFCIRCDYLK